MSTLALVERIAKYLCKEADDDWSLGAKLYTEQAHEILAMVREADSDIAADRAEYREGMRA